MADVRQKFLEALGVFRIDELIASADRVIVAYSGGADSQTLLRLLFPYVRERGKDLVCAHVNHMIRGDDAFRDEQRCREWTKGLGVPIRVLRADVPAISEERGTGIEETARNVRYAFFEELRASFEGTTLIATAHNADDNLETVIFNMMRGAGLNGICGIPPVRDGVYIRPLLLCGSDEIRAFCAENDVPFNVDNTNTDTEYSRNYIRGSVVPTLSRLSPSPADAVARMCASLREDGEFLESEARRAASRYEDGAASRRELRGLHDAILSRVLMILYSFAGTGISLAKTHVASLVRGIRSDNPSLSVDLPGDCVFSVSYDKVTFEKKSDYDRDARAEFKRVLKVDGDPFSVGVRLVRISSSPVEKIEYNGIIYNLFKQEKTSFDKIKGDFFVRNRKEGDSYRFGGMTRKVKKLLSEAQVPVKDRDLVPIFCDEVGILWIPGFPLRDGLRYDPSDGSGEVFLCCYLKKE